MASPQSALESVLDPESEIGKLQASLRASLQRHIVEQDLLLQSFSQKFGIPKHAALADPSEQRQSSPSKTTPNDDTLAPDGPMSPDYNAGVDEGVVADAIPDSGETARGKSEDISQALSNLENDHRLHRQASLHRAHHNFIDHFANSIRFDVIVGAIIALNVALMLVHLEYEGRMLEGAVFYGEPVRKIIELENFFSISEHVFTAFFAFELVFRLAALGTQYLKSVANIFDACIVVICSLDAWVFTPMKSDVMSNTAFIRLLRLVRLSKVFRVLRLMKAFAALRVLMAAIINSIGALLWSMTLLFVFELVGALLMARIVQPMIKDPEVPDEIRSFLWETFGTCFQAYISMFELTMAPGSVLKYRRLYDEVSALLAFFFVGYSILVTFAVVRVITAMFLKATLAAANADEGRMRELKVEERSEYTELLKGAMANICGDMLKEEEFGLLNELPRMSSWLAEVGMGKDQQHMLFQALEENGEVSYAEFLHAVERMSGPNYVATDLLVQLYQTRRTQSELKRLLETGRCHKYVL